MNNFENKDRAIREKRWPHYIALMNAQASEKSQTMKITVGHWDCGITNHMNNAYRLDEDMNSIC